MGVSNGRSKRKTISKLIMNPILEALTPTVVMIYGGAVIFLIFYLIEGSVLWLIRKFAIIF